MTSEVPAPPDRPDPLPDGDAHPPRGSSRSSRWVVLGLVGILAAVGVGVFVVAVLPRWWAHRVGDAADGRFSGAIWLGLCVGLACTALPLAVWARALGRRHGEPDADRPRKGWGGRTWRARLLYAAAGLVLAAPNLLTLGIQLGSGNAAHAADRTLDVEAPGFRGATLAGALIAVALMAALGVLVRGRRTRGEELRRVKAELDEVRSGQRPAPADASD